MKELLDKWNICYTAVFAILDYYDAQGEVEYFENGEFKVSENCGTAPKPSIVS